MQLQDQVWFRISAETFGFKSGLVWYVCDSIAQVSNTSKFDTYGGFIFNVLGALFSKSQRHFVRGLNKFTSIKGVGGGD